MKYKNTISRLALAVSVTAAMPITQAPGAAISHFNPGVMNIRDYLEPEPGFYGVLYNYFYTSGQYNNDQGNAVNSININPGPGPGVTVNIDPSLNAYAVSPAVIWVSPWNLAGIKYGALIAPTFANANAEVEISTLRTTGRNASTSTFGVGDMLVEPVWLGYTLTNWDFTLGYGVYAPVGKYNTQTINVLGQTFTTTSPDNIGLGFWTHQIQGAGAWYPWADRRMAVVGALTYQINSKQDDIDYTAGQLLTFNWGVSQYVPLTKDHNLLLEIGPAGYDAWQISDDSGSAAGNPSARSQVHAAGGQLGLTYVPWNAALNFHAFYEYAANNRLQGQAYGISFAIKF